MNEILVLVVKKERIRRTASAQLTTWWYRSGFLWIGAATIPGLLELKDIHLDSEADSAGVDDDDVGHSKCGVRAIPEVINQSAKDRMLALKYISSNTVAIFIGSGI